MDYVEGLGSRAGSNSTSRSEIVQMFGFATGVLSGFCGAFLALALGTALWKTSKPARLIPKLSAARSVRTCHGLLVVAGLCDFFYAIGVFIHQPFLPESVYKNPIMCTIQGVMIDFFLLAPALCICCLAHEIHFIHTSLLVNIQGGLPTPEEEWHNRKRRSFAYGFVILLVPLTAVLLNQFTAEYGSQQPGHKAWCWLKRPSKLVNDFFGFFLWIWLCGGISLIFNLITAKRLREASVMQIHSTDSQDIRLAKLRARRKALGMTAYPFIFIAAWIPGSVRHFSAYDPLWLEVLHFACVGAIGIFQLAAWLILNRTVRHLLIEKLDDWAHCRCGERARSKSNLLDISTVATGSGLHDRLINNEDFEVSDGYTRGYGASMNSNQRGNEQDYSDYPDSDQ